MPSFQRTKNIFTTALFIFFVLACSAQTLKTGGAQNAAVDYKRLANIDTLANGYVDRGWINGVVTIIVKDGQVVQYKGYGYADAATKKPMQANSIFRIASQTKAIVSAGILILYDQGKIFLNDPVSKYIPEFAH